MKLRAITLENVRRFSDPVRMDGISDGLNILCEPNEHGKSTLFDALQALFFKPHGSRDKEVAALRPHAGGAPEVSVEIETGAGRFTIAKRWFQKARATVHQDGRLIAQADAAEAWIADQLGGQGGGPSGLIWVRQGLTGLGGGTMKEQKAALEARRDLMSSVGKEVAAMTGGRRMDRALARCREELETYATSGTRKPRKDGPWKAAQDRVLELTNHRDGLAVTAADLHDALADRKRARRELRGWEDPEAASDRQQKLETARAAHDAALRHAEQVDAAARKVDVTRLRAERAQQQLDGLRAAMSEHKEAALRETQAATQARTTASKLEQRRHALETARQAQETAQAGLTTAENSLRRAERARTARDGADRRRELESRIAEAETVRATMEQAAVAARTGPDAAALRRIETLSAAHAAALAARNATAPQIVAHYETGRHGTIRLADEPLVEGQHLPVPRASRLTIEGIGTLEIRPGDPGHEDSTVERAAAALRKALDAVGAESLDALRTAVAARTEAERRLGEAKAVYASLAPEGIDRLREVLTAIPSAEEDPDAPAVAEAEAAMHAARAAYDTARTAFQTASDLHADARSEATRRETELISVRDRLGRAEVALAGFDTASDTELAAAASRALKNMQDAEEALADLSRDAPDLASTEAALARAVSADQRARDEIARLKPLLARLDERIGRASGDAVEERLRETEQELEAARGDLDRIQHQVAVLIRLETALEAARNDARDRYFSPVAKELKPLLHLLWPDAELTWEEDSLLPVSMIRGGQEEPVDVLSGGTQEQVALLVRLAFARMLSGSGRVAPVILDDALVFTDDDRIERMFVALHRQANDLQIIVLSCRQRAFRDLGGTVLRLTAVAE